VARTSFTNNAEKQRGAEAEKQNSKRVEGSKQVIFSRRGEKGGQMAF
jgi:hypothetical protein